MEKSSVELAARQFLNTGSAEGVPESDLVQGCDALILQAARKSLKEALDLARQYVARAKSRGQPLALSAYRALARITHMSGAHADALQAYLKARSLARRDQLTRARIDRALVDVYMYLGDLNKSRQAAQAAIRTFTRLKADSDLAQTQVNYANVLHRQDRHRQAEQLYRQAGEFFEGIDNRLAVARCDYNRANTLVQLFDFPTAESLYLKAMQIYTSEDYDLDANDARYGLAWLRMLKGQFHLALLDLDACEKVYHDGGDPRGEALCKLDRAEVYLGLGLNPDARDISRTAEHMFKRLGLRYELAKASLFRSQAALALDSRAEARSSLERARVGFTAESNRGFLGVVDLVASDLEKKNSVQRKNVLKQARAKFARAQLPFWQAVCDLKDAASSTQAKAALARLKRNDAVQRVPHLYAFWQTVSGDYLFHHGDLSNARHHWQNAADRLDAVRAELPPVELRDAFARKHDLPHTRLIRTELDRDPMIAAAWSERYKTAGVWSRIAPSDRSLPARRRVEESLQSLARSVAALANQIGGTSGERSLSVQSGSQALGQLQKQLRNELIALEKNDRGHAEALEMLTGEFRKTSRSRPVVQFHVGNDEILAFVHDKGDTRVTRFKDGRRRIDQAMHRWRYILESELLVDHLGGVNVADAERHLWQELGEWLWKPLNVRSDSEEILVLPEGELANLPWFALTVDGVPLVDRHRFVLSPSLRHYRSSRSIHSKSNKVAVFRGVADNLPHVDRELEALTALAGDAARTYSPCRRGDWPNQGDYRLWHYAGHAHLRQDNPFYSSLALHDGPLFAVDFRLKSCRVELATLASCRSGQFLAVPGAEATGLVRSLLEMGVRNVVAGHWPVSDEATAIWMGAFYEQIFSGHNVSGAVRHAARTVREKRPSAYYWAAFSTFGAGD